MRAGQKLDRERRPPPGPAPRIQLPAFRRFRLSNGVQVLTIRHDNLPEVSARLVLGNGATSDPGGRSGTALMVARALTEGTAERSAGDVAAALDHLGARFSLDVNHDSTVLSLDFLSRVQDAAFDLLAEIVTQPAFEANEIGRLKEERLDEIASGLDEPRVVASLRWNEVNFGEHPYGMRTGGVEDTVRAIDRDVLRDYHSNYYRPGSATLILVGDLPGAAELEARLERAFGGWQGESTPAEALDDPQPATTRRLWAIPWDGPQSELRIGGIGISRLDPDYPAVIVMNAILGGLFSSRINMNLREDKGWTYGASSRFDARKLRGPYYTGTAVDARASASAVREILGEMERMKTEPPSAEELELAINALTLSLPRLFETVGQVSGRVAQQVIYGLPDDYWEKFSEFVRAVTRSDVERVAERLLDVERATIVIVGPVRDFTAELEALGAVEMRDIYGRPLEG